MHNIPILWLSARDGGQEVVNSNVFLYSRSSVCCEGDFPTATGGHTKEMVLTYSHGEHPGSVQLDDGIT